MIRERVCSECRAAWPYHVQDACPGSWVEGDHEADYPGLVVCATCPRVVVVPMRAVASGRVRCLQCEPHRQAEGAPFPDVDYGANGRSHA